MGIFKKIAKAVDKVETKLADKLFGDEGEDLTREVRDTSKDDKNEKGK